MMFRKGSRKDAVADSLAVQPAYMSKDQVAGYLSQLRSQKVVRPHGSRPPPARTPLDRRAAPTPPPDQELAFASSLASLEQKRQVNSTQTSRSSSGESRKQSPPAEYQISSDTSRSRHVNHDDQRNDDGLCYDKYPGLVRPRSTYLERGDRWIERQEARSLRAALEEMDMHKDERIQLAAEKEASELVQNHRRSLSPQKLRGQKSIPDYRSHLRHGSVNRRSQVEAELGQYVPVSSRNVSGSSKSSGGGDAPSRSTPGGSQLSAKAKSLQWELPGSNDADGKAYKDTLGALVGTGARIPEEEEPTSPQKPIISTATATPNAPSFSRSPGQPRGPRPVRNSLSSGRKPWNLFSRTRTEPIGSALLPTPPDSATASDAEASNKPTLPDGIEIRSDEIRQATSKRFRERSPNLPSPTAVSQKPGRPIVSFDPNWQPPVDEAKRARSPVPEKVRARLSEPARLPVGIPMINLPDESPTIQISAPEDSRPRPPVPSFSLSIDPHSTTTSTSTPTARPSTIAPPQTTRPPARHSASAPIPSTTPSTNQRYTFAGLSRAPRTDSCASCSGPISGRTIHAAGAYLHPSCFACEHCRTPLENVAFYPEPAAELAARQQQHTSDPQQNQNQDQQQQQQLRPRFYCHLDYHELFSARCASCSTPIEGDCVLACGRRYHEGHFFCAGCGDPFARGTPFVEHGGYAWCSGCDLKRRSGNCRACGGLVTGEGVVALGVEWHGGCFVCMVCKAPFKDDRFFLSADGETVLCFGCEDRRLKA